MAIQRFGDPSGMAVIEVPAAEPGPSQVVMRRGALVATAARDDVRAEQFAAAIRGELHPVVHRTLPLDQAADAHRKMDAGTVFGRIVLTP